MEGYSLQFSVLQSSHVLGRSRFPVPPGEGPRFPHLRPALAKPPDLLSDLAEDREDFSGGSPFWHSLAIAHHRVHQFHRRPPTHTHGYYDAYG